jgi:hypothetical protein
MHDLRDAEDAKARLNAQKMQQVYMHEYQPQPRWYQI